MERLKYGRLFGSRLMPQPTYGFSTGLMSTARPKACSDQLPVPLPPLHGDGSASPYAHHALAAVSRRLCFFFPDAAVLCMLGIGRCSVYRPANILASTRERARVK